jgi:hypothetical protein
MSEPNDDDEVSGEGDGHGPAPAKKRVKAARHGASSAPARKGGDVEFAQHADTVQAAASASAAGTAAADAAAGAVAGFHSDGIDGQVDLLDITRDVEALCSVIAARDVEPPLSIGLFGDWGSGKSFFIKEMKQRLARLAAAAGRAEQPTRYCAHITQLDFNAWHYIETDLWASLTDGIIDGLARSLDAAKPSAAAERARLLALAAHSRDVLADAERLRSDAEAKLAEQQQAYERARSRAFDVALDPRSIARQARVLAVAAGGTLPDELEEVGRALEADAATVEAKATLLELRGVRGGLRALGIAIRAHGRRVVIGLVAAAAIAAAALIFEDQLGRAAATLAGIAAGALALVAALRLYVARARRAVRQVATIAVRYKKELDAKVAAAERDAKARRAQLQGAVTAAATRVREAQDELVKIEDQLIALRADHQMARFLRERQDGDAYRKHLGVIAQARSDFERLSRYMIDIRADAPRDGLPRIDRIVLYIDDLDRCAEAEVVKVLQAVHLLLAFRLFVVVVAVDPRWLLRSLQQHSKFFQAGEEADQGLSEEERLHWQATPLNYLEKIFQIPFTLKPMGPGGFGKLVEHLTSQLGAPSEAAAPAAPPAGPAAADIDVHPPHLAIEPWEQDFMKEFHELIPTPRAAKRFVNVYRLLRARAAAEHGAERWGGAAGGEHRAVMVLLALLIGSPSEATDLMRDLVEMKPGGDWWAWSKARLGAERPGATPVEQARLGALAARLEALEARFVARQLALPGCDVFCRWAPYVGRFSFHAGRLAGAIRA